MRQKSYYAIQFYAFTRSADNRTQNRIAAAVLRGDTVRVHAPLAKKNDGRLRWVTISSPERERIQATF